jgi:hypothetical protein
MLVVGHLQPKDQLSQKLASTPQFQGTVIWQQKSQLKCSIPFQMAVHVNIYRHVRDVNHAWHMLQGCKTYTLCIIIELKKTKEMRQDSQTDFLQVKN